MSAVRFEQFCDRLRSLLASPSALFLAPLTLLIWRLIRWSPADPDLFARIGMGRLVAELGSVPLYDPFAFTQKLPLWIDHEWLSGVVFYYLGIRWGDPGLIILKLFVAGWTYLLLVRAARIYSPQAKALVIWSCICLLEASFLWMSTIRCQVFTYFFIALTYYGFVQYRIAGVWRYLALIPFTSVALVNMHGGYALQIVVLWLLTGVSILERRRWKLLAVVSLLASCAPAATPYGYDTFVSYLVHALGMERPSISEWRALYEDPAALARMLSILTPVIVGIFLSLRAKKFDLLALTLLAFSFYCGFKHIRFTGFTMLTALVFGAGYFARTIDLIRARLGSYGRMLERSVAFVGSVLLVGMLAQIVVACMRPQTWKLDMKGYPVRAIEWLRSSEARGRLLVDFNNGSFALWRLYPRFLISMDGRYEEVYTTKALEDVSSAFSPHTAKGAAALQSMAPTHILFDARYLSDSIRVALSPEWREVYRDETNIIFTKFADHPHPASMPGAEIELWQLEPGWAQLR